MEWRWVFEALVGKDGERPTWVRLGDSPFYDDAYAIQWIAERIQLYGPPTQSTEDFVQWDQLTFPIRAFAIEAGG